jgi:hypothetical protein
MYSITPAIVLWPLSDTAASPPLLHPAEQTHYRDLPFGFLTYFACLLPVVHNLNHIVMKT